MGFGDRMKILITGSDGQLGKELGRNLSLRHSVVGVNRKKLDITEKEKVEKFIFKSKPDIIIHCAAFTAVDQCEISRKEAILVNGFATGFIAKAADKIGARMLYISSDYVFDGAKLSPYVEEDEPNPQSIYGLSKWIGEQFVLQMKKGTIIRTSWLYGHGGKNFVNTMLQLAKQQKEVRVVHDQIGSPTYVNDLAGIIGQLFNKRDGIYHVTNSGSCTWFTFAKAIFKEAGYNPNHVVPITSQEYGAPAPRPHSSALATKALVRENIQPPRHWHDALREFIREENAR
jgi:dTDP-4-dehydrorhamnose reductase